ncbi:MAG: hypothetical protein BWY32_01426 [bacterium ADurb.Bin243]|nr:MAG: hypothetical protein BWY32_01426 [bacterium ADurb.Bin243]HOD42352.1 hypothetical protein [Candidatus Wallbacteria bacterium]
MAKNKNSNDQADKIENNQSSAENQGADGKSSGGDISAVKFNQIFIAIGVCALLMIIAKMLGL